MEPILELLVQCPYEENDPPYVQYLIALQHVKQYVGEDWRFTDSVFKNCSQQTYYIDHELFREERIAQGYSQEQMIEGIYKNPESLSRAERGKVTMRDSRLSRLFKKLGIEKCRYNGFVVTDRYEDLELKQQIDILISRNCDAEAEKKLEELKRRLDLSIAENRRTVQGYEIAIEIKKGEKTKEELLKRARTLLEETYRLKKQGIYRSPMDREASLINQIGVLLQKLGKTEEARRLLYNITAAMQKSKVNIRKRSRKYSLLRSNLAKWEQSVLLAKENIQFTLECGKLRTLPMDYMTIACALIDNPANFETCRAMIKDVYYLCDLVQNSSNRIIAGQYYFKKFNEQL